MPEFKIEKAGNPPKIIEYYYKLYFFSFVSPQKAMYADKWNYGSLEVKPSSKLKNNPMKNNAIQNYIPTKININKQKKLSQTS